MNWETLAQSEIIGNVGWTLVHSVWQIALLAFVLFLLLRALQAYEANVRYIVSVAALMAAFIIPVITFFQISTASTSEIGITDLSKREFLENGERMTRMSDDLSKPANTQAAVSTPMDRQIFASAEAVRRFFRAHFPAVLPFAVAMWLLGVGFFSLRLFGGVWQLHRYRTQGISGLDADWQVRFSTLCGELGLHQQVKLLKSTLIETPIAIGFLKPLIILPASIVLQIHPRELETIIAHELIHIRRYDPLVNIVQCVNEVLFFYHPGVRWISAQIRREREFATDAAVMEIFENSHVIYANALVNLEEIRFSTNKKTPSIATAANGGNLMQRIQRILQKNTEMKHANSAWTAGLALGFISAVLLGLFSFNSTAFVNAQTKVSNRKLAIGFVSIPPLDRSANPPKDSDATTRLMIAKLTQHKIPAIGFVQGGLISDGEKLFPVRANIVRLWRDAGFEIGIGGFKHIWFSSNTYEDYVANIVKNEGVVKQILDEKNQEIRYFSYPFLNTGGNLEDRTKFEGWLKDRNYRFIPYTFDNDEWLYSFAYDAARKDNDINTMNMVRTEFLEYMQKMLTYYEEYSQDMFQRDIAQTMVLTPSRLVADSADDLFGMFEKRGYAFVSMGEALADKAYQTPETVVIANSGISWFKRWASKQGKMLREEPKVSEEVARIWKKAESKK